MERVQTGAILIIIGALLFVVSLFVLLQISDLYLASLFLMFLSSVMIGIGSAIIKGFDRSLDGVPDECYYCKGTGKIDEDEGDDSATCPRCGGSGLARADDYD
ncbi:MAG: hypothetical protein RTU30_11235 [Candidatus Thorarchaeota archaeon]